MNYERSNAFLKTTMNPFMLKTHLKGTSDNEPYNLQNLQFSVDTIIFCCRGNHSQYIYNRQLILTNNTGVAICFKIKSNNPQSYEVFPFEQCIENGKNLQIRFRLNVKGNNIHKYNVDRFQFQWGKLGEEGKYVLTESCIIKVKMETETVMNEKLIEEVKKEEKGEDHEKILKELLQKNLKEIKKINEKIEKLEEENCSQIKHSKIIFLFSGLVSFLIGFFIS